MGADKSMLVYYDKPQRYHVYETLKSACERVFISCNKSQLTEISSDYETLADLPRYENIGPIAALLTAFDQYPDKDFLAIGCDYPFITVKDIKDFLRSAKERKPVRI